MRRARTSCLIISAACGAAELLAAQTTTFARLYPDNLVQILDWKQNSWRTIHQSPAWGTTALSVGPTGDRLALLSWTKGTVAGHDYVDPPASELIVIDTAGRVVAPAVAQVQRYAWCGARCIVFLTGQYEESHYGFRPSGVGVLDIETGKTRSLPSPSTPIGITWASFDSAAYVKNLPRTGEAYIYRLDLARGTLEPTELEGHRFSPSGRFYLLDGEFTDTLVVYDTRANTPVDIEGFRRNAIVVGWISPSEDLLLAVRRPPRRSPRAGRRRPRPRDPNEFQPYVLYTVYDLAAGRVRDTVTGHLKEWSGSGNLRLVERDGKYHLVGAR